MVDTSYRPWLGPSPLPSDEYRALARTWSHQPGQTPAAAPGDTTHGAAILQDELMIRWEQQEDGSWHGLSGEFVVATVTRDEGEQGQWLWTVTALNSSARRVGARVPGTVRAS